MENEPMAAVAAFMFRTEKRNCAEAVVGAWQKVSGEDPELTENLAGCGFGGAPQGVCGAVYAAQLISDEDKKAELSQRFADTAGSLVCGEIRSTRKISCTACVKLAATLLEENL
ncbi:MAG TPA: C-GCAxxG-C-C family (seleno)protein [Geobacteraceae bacterium]|nr:C-GCAxxG-C-C family (seleno)protein [Geobacteraceae bacterium]